MAGLRTHIILVVLILLCSGFSAQNNQVRYYADAELKKEVKKKEKALFQWETSHVDGLTSSVVTEISSGRIIRSEYHRGDEQVGKWVLPAGNGGSRELNYDFDLYYRNSSCEDVNQKQGVGSDSVSVTVPVPDPGGSEFLHQLFRGLIYPVKARDMDIQGRTYVSFTINEEGRVEDPHVVRSAHIMLDKEAVRVIREAKFTVPPMKNGKPVRMCFTIPVSFSLR